MNPGTRSRVGSLVLGLPSAGAQPLDDRAAPRPLLRSAESERGPENPLHIAKVTQAGLDLPESLCDELLDPSAGRGVQELSHVAEREPRRLSCAYEPEPMQVFF